MNNKEAENILNSNITNYSGNLNISTHYYNDAIFRYLLDHLEEDGYKEILNDESLQLSQEQKQMYENLLKSEKERRKEEIQMDSRMRKSEMPKEYIYTKQNTGRKRNGFTNALLLSLITTLFGGLCLTYFFIFGIFR